MKQVISTAQIEKRPYNEDATIAEIEAIKNRVYIHEGDIIYMKEMPVMSDFSVHILFDRVEELATGMQKYSLLIDLNETRRPDAKSRRAVNQRFGVVWQKLYHAAFYTGKNGLLNTAIRFVLFQTKLESYSVNSSLEESFAAIKSHRSNG